MARWLVVVVLSGCGFQLNLSSSSDAGGDDDAADAPDGPMGCSGWDARHVMPCAIGEPAPALDLDSAMQPFRYDTTNGGGELRDATNALLFASNVTATQSDQSVIAVMNVESFRLGAGATMYVVGDKPLLIASWDTIDIAGTLDASSHGKYVDNTNFIWETTQVGAGANRDCANHVGTSGTDALSSGGSGGGGGGGFAGEGGDASGGDQCATGCPRSGGPGGAKFPAAPTVIRGGCPGGTSGTAGSGTTDTNNETARSKGGGGGGAIELSAKNAIAITGSVLAGGAGGSGAWIDTANGGGGGGSGGYIGLDAPAIAIAGIVAANGGGGGSSGPFANTPAHGWPGTDGGASSSRAEGGVANNTGNCGVAGAQGGALQTDGSNATTMDSCGGGGGGGGAGFVLAFTQPTTQGATISPAVVVVP